MWHGSNLPVPRALLMRLATASLGSCKATGLPMLESLTAPVEPLRGSCSFWASNPGCAHFVRDPGLRYETPLEFKCGHRRACILLITDAQRQAGFNSEGVSHQSPGSRTNVSAPWVRKNDEREPHRGSIERGYHRSHKQCPGFAVVDNQHFVLHR